MEYATIVRWLKREGDDVEPARSYSRSRRRKRPRRSSRRCRVCWRRSHAPAGDEIRVGDVMGTIADRPDPAGTAPQGGDRWSLAETLEHLLLQMWQIRCFERAPVNSSTKGLIHGPVHSVRRHGSDRCRRVLEPRAPNTTDHEHPPRPLGTASRKGLDLARMMAEILGRVDGYCRGHGGSMHITAIDKGMLGRGRDRRRLVRDRSRRCTRAATSGEDGVIVCFFGDGAANQGILHEAFNLAAVLEAPVVFVCENNEWAISTPISAVDARRRHRRSRSRLRLSRAWLWTATTCSPCGDADRGVDRARAGAGPTLIEAKSYRMAPHSPRAEDSRATRGARRVAEPRSDPPLTRDGSSTAAPPTPTARRALDAAATRSVERRRRLVALGRSPPQPGAALEDVYAPAAWRPRGGCREHGCRNASRPAS